MHLPRHGLAPPACLSACLHPAPQAPSEIKGKAVDDVINEWNAELEKRSRAFVRHAEALAEWDKHILRNRHALLGLEQQLKQVGGGQHQQPELSCSLRASLSPLSPRPLSAPLAFPS